MNWKNLLENRCPKCRKYLEWYPNEEMMMCTLRCGFMIEKGKMERICVDITIGKLGSQGDFEGVDNY